MSVFRIYVEKKPDFAVEARAVLKDLQTALRCNIFNVINKGYTYVSSCFIRIAKMHNYFCWYHWIVNSLVNFHHPLST